MGLYFILKALKQEGYTTPTPIQAQAIPLVLEGNDLLGCAQTGTGKTAAFTIPILQLLSANKSFDKKKKIRSLIVTPTRELAIQIAEAFAAIGKNTKVHAYALIGGIEQDPQIQKMQLGIDILIATPGRLFDLIHQGFIDLNQLQTLVVDEADHMLNLGFFKDIKDILINNGFELLPNDNYIVNLYPDALTDFLKTTNDTISYKFKTKSRTEYGTLKLGISNVKEYPIIIHLTNNKYELIRKKILNSFNDPCVFEYLKPADYFVKVIFDENKNKIWDTGNFLNRIQPEEVFHFKEEFVIRANWIIEEKIVVD